MKKSALLSIVIVAVLLAVAVVAQAQQSAKVPRVGFVSGSSGESSPFFKTFRYALEELGYVEGKNIAVF